METGGRSASDLYVNRALFTRTTCVCSVVYNLTLKKYVSCRPSHFERSRHEILAMTDIYTVAPRYGDSLIGLCNCLWFFSGLRRVVTCEENKCGNSCTVSVWRVSNFCLGVSNFSLESLHSYSLESFQFQFREFPVSVWRVSTVTVWRVSSFSSESFPVATCPANLAPSFVETNP